MFPASVLLVCIFILTITMKFATPWALENGCSLKIQLSLLLNDSSCGAAFDAYLYALGQQANETGKIYIDSNEQIHCLSRLKSFKDNIFGCGIENLASGAGGCSDFLVADVSNKFGNELRSLDGNCQFKTLGNETEQSCSSCLRTWKTIGGTGSRRNNNKSEKNETDLCRIAVLVTLISRKIENEKYVHTVLRCLGAQNSYSGSYKHKL